jgi:Xaa-Pro aminopeptidase
MIELKERVDLASDLRDRLERVQNEMRKQNVGGLIVYYRGQHNMLRMDQVFYLTDFRSIGQAVLLVPREGQTRLLITPTWDVERAREATGVSDVTGVEPNDFVRKVAEAARSLPQPLALSGKEIMPVDMASKFAATFGADLPDGGKIIPTVSATRTPAELERIEHASTIADEGFKVLCETARVGMREYELAAEVEAAMQALGAEDNFGLIAAGNHNVAIRPPSDRRLEAGDVIIGEITPMYKGYLAQLCRTFILGEPNAVQREKYDMLIAALAHGMEAGKPGVRSADIAKAVNDVVGGAGYAEYCRQPYMRTRGHSLGLGAVVPFDLNEDSGPLLEEHMTMVIHPNQYLPETGYMMLGDTVVIESNGPRALTKSPIRLYWKSV